MTPALSRRALLGGTAAFGTAVAASACGIHLLGGNRSPKDEGTLSSAAMGGRQIGWTIAYPKGRKLGDSLPVVVSLHGRGASHRTTFDTLHFDDVLDDVVGAGTPPFAIAAVDGGDDSYWHQRAEGTDAGAMVRDEFIPLLADRDLDTTRLGLYGWSMGGYGALLLAGKEHVATRAVAVSSPALFTSAAASAPGAFDNAEDYETNDVFAHPEWVGGLRLRVDCGRQDPFYVATRDYVARLQPPPAGGFINGGHDPAYWRSVAPGHFASLAERFRGADRSGRCRRRR